MHCVAFSELTEFQTFFVKSDHVLIMFFEQVRDLEDRRDYLLVWLLATDHWASSWALYTELRNQCSCSLSYKLRNMFPKKWGWLTLKFFSCWTKVKSSLGWEFNSGWDLPISLLEKSSHLVQEVISFSLHPNARVSSRTEKQIGSRQRLPNTQYCSNPPAFLWMEEWFLLLPLPATLGQQRERDQLLLPGLI